MNINAQAVIDKMVEIYGENICDPDVFPRQFEFQIKMAIHSLKCGM